MSDIEISVIVRHKLLVWWIGKDGSDIVMPKFRKDGFWTSTGKQDEEMIHNFMHHEKYVGYQVMKYFQNNSAKRCHAKMERQHKTVYRY